MTDRSTLEKINYELINTFAHVRVDPLDLTPWQIAEGLQTCSVALEKYIKHANSLLGVKSEAHIPIEVSQAIGSLLSQLSSNFFPMAHTIEPLRGLQIVEKMKLNALKKQAYELQKILEDFEIEIDRVIRP